MKRVGLIGGMSWESSLEYYRLLNELVKKRLGKTHSADCIMYSFDFDEVEKLQHQGNWEELTKRMVAEANNLRSAKAEAIVICTNTMHKMAPHIEKEGIPVIHIAEATADEIIRRKNKKVLLLGTKFTMEGDFYRSKLNDKGIEVMIPNEEDRDTVHNIIYHELILGTITVESKKKYLDIINRSIKNGAEGVVLGCTEIPLLIKDEDTSIEVYDTTFIHSSAAVDYMLK